jgi:hypothetical protein
MKKNTGASQFTHYSSSCAKDYPGFDQTQGWQLGKSAIQGKGLGNHDALHQAIQHTTRHKDWHWPKQPILFLTDPHADAEAFVSSLEMSGAISRSGRKHPRYTLSRTGQESKIIIGGDCLDKGPSNLKLLRSIRKLSDMGAQVSLLAGNHDIRLLMGLNALTQEKEPGDEHFLLRMSPKVIPLIKEVHDHYILGHGRMSKIPGSKACKEFLYPSERWFDEFPKHSAQLLSELAIDKELQKMKKKTENFESACDDAGLCIRRAYAGINKCRELFMSKSGEFSWFFRHMKLAHRDASFLFVHAGLDDHVAHLIKNKGIQHLNHEYQKRSRSDLSSFYYGPLANMMRTKYRKSDAPLTHGGVDKVHQQGIHAVLHGHRNRQTGQRLMLRKGLFHFECDITMDRHSRKKEGLEGPGAGVTIVHPEGKVVGLSKDYPYAKVFEPHIHLS